MRPDLSFGSLSLSFNNKNAKVQNIFEAKKIIKFSKIGTFQDLKILTHTDASYMTMEQKSKSVAGKIIFLSNKDKTLGRSPPQIKTL